MKQFACFIALAAALSGCASVEQEAASYAEADAAACQDYGARPGTSAYYTCRMSKNREHQFNAQIQRERIERFGQDLQVTGAEIMRDGY
jgi:uncharacterized protein YceK